MIISEQWADALDPIVRKWFEVGFARRAPLLAQLFNVQSSQRSYEEVSGIGVISPDAWDNYENAGVPSVVDFDQGYKKTYTHKEKVIEVKIERKLVDDNQFPQIFNIAQRAGDSAAVKRENDAAGVFINAFTDTAPYAGADSVGLCSTAHPYGPSKTGVTQSNEFTYSLTKANVRLVREAMMAVTDDAGQPLAVTPDLLLVPPELEDDALVIARSMMDPTTANNAINPMANRFDVVTWHYLTDSNSWFLIDRNLMKMSLDWFDRVPLSIVPKVEDKTLKATWIAYMRYSFGWSDWKWVAGSNPS